MPTADAIEYKLGTEVERNKQKWLVVRIVEKDTALIHDDQGKEVVSTETYVMLKSEAGEIDFVVLLREETPFTANHSISTLPNFWRRSNAETT